jgi:hypothetical protein
MAKKESQLTRIVVDKSMKYSDRKADVEVIFHHFTVFLQPDCVFLFSKACLCAFMYILCEGVDMLSCQFTKTTSSFLTQDIFIKTVDHTGKVAICSHIFL